MIDLDYAGVWFMIAGLVIVVGSVNVIDWLAWFGRKSSYWTESTIRAHKVTKPLDWVGAGLFLLGILIWHGQHGWDTIGWWQVGIWTVLCLNGAYLSFIISPELLRREKSGRIAEILPVVMQRKITASFLVSIVGWWTEISLLVWVLAQK